MKKVVIAVAGLLASLSVYAAQVENSTFAPTLSASASLGWNFHLGTKASGFTNSANLSLKVPLLGPQSFSTLPSESVYGLLEIANAEISLLGDNSSSTAIPLASGTVSAKIVFKPFYLSVFSKSELSKGKDLSEPISSDDANVAPTNNTTPAYDVGTAFGMNSLTNPDLPLEFRIKVLSGNGVWTNNTTNDYAFGVDFNATVIPEILSIDTRVFWNPYAIRPYLNAGLSAPITLDVLYGLTITPAADFQYDPRSPTNKRTADASLNIGLALSPENAKDKRSTGISAKAFMGSDGDITARAAFQEPDQGGIIDALGFSVSYEIDKFVLSTADIQWNVSSTVQYRLEFDEFSRLEPSATYVVLGGGNTISTTLTPKISFTNELGISATTLTIEYLPGDVLATNPSWTGGQFGAQLTLAF